MCFVPVLGTKCINPPFGTRTPKVGTNYINPFYFMGDWETRTPKVLDTKCMNPPKVLGTKCIKHLLDLDLGF